jgi:hypothetical protein
LVMRLAWRPMAAGENGAWHSGSRGLLTRKRSLGLALQQEGGGRLLTWRSRRKASHSAKLDTRRPSPSLGNQPPRRPPSQQRPVGHHPDPVAHRPRHPRLRTTAHHPRQDHQEIMRLLKRYLAREIDPPPHQPAAHRSYRLPKNGRHQAFRTRVRNQRRTTSPVTGFRDPQDRAR